MDREACRRCSPRGRKESERTERLTGTGTQTRRPIRYTPHGGSQSRDAAALSGAVVLVSLKGRLRGGLCGTCASLYQSKDSCPGQLAPDPWRVCWGHFPGEKAPG